MKKDSKSQRLSASSVCGNHDPVLVRDLLSKVGDKWSVLLIFTLVKVYGGRARFSELGKTIPDISQRMLTLTLRNLERDGLVTRQVFPEVPPRVEYEITKLGKSLVAPVEGLLDWVKQSSEDVRRAQSKFDGKK